MTSCSLANIPASPSTTGTVTLPVTGSISFQYIPIRIINETPKRLGGKDMTMKDINRLRYGRKL